MRMHVETLFTTDDRGRLLRVNEPGGSEAPRLFVGRTTGGVVVRFRHDVVEEVVAEVTALLRSDTSTWQGDGDRNRYVAVLARHAEVRKPWSGPAYLVPPRVDPAEVALAASTEAARVTRSNQRVLDRYLSEWIPDVAEDRPMVAWLVEGHAVSVCCSVRTGHEAHEAGVETHPEFRGRGFAGRVVSAWAEAVRERGRIPLYSTAWENERSIAVATKSGLVRYGSTVHVT